MFSYSATHSDGVSQCHMDVCVCVSHAEVMKFGRSPGALTTSLCSLSYMFPLRLQTTSSQWSLRNKGPLIEAGSQ